MKKFFNKLLKNCDLFKGKANGFTLAEVLITLGIIGIVAVLTIPNLLSDINQRKFNTASSNFQRKFGEALKIMNAQNTLKGHTTTLSFVNELGKNFKIFKVCNTVTDCFPAEFQRSSGTVINTSTLTSSTSLGKDYGTSTVGIVFANGIRAIVAYNPNYTTQSGGDIVSFSTDDTNKSVKMNTSVISMIFDVSEDKNNKIGEDIFSINTKFGGSGLCEHTKIGDYCIEDLGVAQPINCKGDSEDIKYCKPGYNNGYGPAFYENDYWAGARKACQEAGMELISFESATEICNYVTNNGGFAKTGTYFTSTVGRKCSAVPSTIGFGYCSEQTTATNVAQKGYRALCIAD